MQSFLNVFSRKAVRVDKVNNCGWLVSGSIKFWGSVSYCMSSSRLFPDGMWFCTNTSIMSYYDTEYYGGGFGQGVSHKTVKAQLSNTQLSGTFL